MTTVNILRVAYVYSGRPNCCMCGCKGSHSYASAFVATNNPGYQPAVSDRSVQAIVKKINDVLTLQTYVEMEETAEYVCVETETRVYVAYFAKELIGDLPYKAGLQGC